MGILKKLRGGALGFLAGALVEASPWGLFFLIAGGAIADDYFTTKNEQDIADENRMEGFEHGVKKGNIETRRKFIEILKKKDEIKKTVFALAICVANLDNEICNDDIDDIQNFLGKVDSNLLYKELKNDFDEILKKKPDFEEVKKEYLDRIESVHLKELDEFIVRVLLFEGGEKATENEIDFYSKQWFPYMKERCGDVDFNDKETDSSATEQIFRKGWQYEHGEEVAQNEKKALFLYETAAQMGHELAKNRLSFLTGVTSEERSESKLHTKQNVYCELTLNSEEAIKGSIKKVKFFSEHECEYCKGTGIAQGADNKSCDVCHGQGIYKREEILKVNIPNWGRICLFPFQYNKHIKGP